MTTHRHICFGEFSLDVESELLWKGPERIRLRPKTYALLLMLAKQPKRLMTKRELLSEIWKGSHVGEEALNHCVAEIRQALNDSAKYPKFIETVSCRGFCFIAETDEQYFEEFGPKALIETSARKPGVLNQQLVGRATELAQLQNGLKEAAAGTRQTIFISGNEGVGKTRLVDAFIESLKDKSNEKYQNGLIARGQCVISHGPNESYMPLIEAIIGISGSGNRNRTASVLRRHAPLWLPLMPKLTQAAKKPTSWSATGSNQEHMMREIAEALEVLTCEKPMILILEDLHWSDYSTLEFISYWTQRKGLSKLLLIATCRPQETSSNDRLKSMKEELQARQLCKDLPIPPLDESEVAEYLRSCYPSHKLPNHFAAWIRERTSGNPLFMINVLSQLMAQNILVLRNSRWVLEDNLKTAAKLVPPTIQQIIERQLLRCTVEEQELLKAASVEGVEFSATGVASIIGGKPGVVAAAFQSLAGQNQFIQVAIYGGARTISYKFVHSLYQQTFYQLLSEKVRVQYHRKIAEYLRRTKSDQDDLASLLAMHMDRGGNPSKAVQYYLNAAEKAISRYAGHDALELAGQGLQLISNMPESADRIELEVQLQNCLGNAVILSRGMGDKEAKLAFSTARFLFRKLSARKQSAKRSILYRALYGLWSYHWIHAEYAAALDFAERMMHVAEMDRNPAMLDHAHYALGWLLMDHGEFAPALKHFRRSNNAYSHSLAALALWYIGYPDRALASLEKILLRDCEAEDLKNSLFARLLKARVHLERRDIQKTFEHAKTAFDLAVEHNFGEPWLAHIRSLYGWALAKKGQTENGFEQIRCALEVIRSYGASGLKPLVLTLYSDLLLNGGQIDEGLKAVGEALDVAGSTGINHMDAELHRLHGECLLQKMSLEKTQDSKDLQLAEMTYYLETAILIARKQGTKSLELRATISLAKCLQKLGRSKEAHRRLKQIYSWFKEGHETADFREAHILLQKLR